MNELERMKSLIEGHLACNSPLEVILQELPNIYQLFSSWQREQVSSDTACQGGCASCCYHWVEDVYSFEAALLAGYIKAAHPDKVETIREFAQSDEREMTALCEDYDGEGDDAEDELLLQFMEEKRPCPLLSSEGLCLAYDVRPFTCRSFFSKSKELCQPENCRSDEEGGPYLLTPGNEIEDLLDELHFRFKSEPVTGLRALLGRLL